MLNTTKDMSEFADLCYTGDWSDYDQIDDFLLAEQELEFDDNCQGDD